MALDIVSPVSKNTVSPLCADTLKTLGPAVAWVDLRAAAFFTGAEEERRKAERAGAFFEAVAKRAGMVREEAGIVGV